MALGRGLGSLIPDKTTIDVRPPKGEAVVMITLTSIAPNPYQPRRSFAEDELQSLAGSIKEHGLLQPIVVCVKDPDTFYIIAGERRFRAMQLLGAAEIPALVRSAEDQQRLELAIVENVQRSELSAIEKAYAYKQLKEEFGLSQKVIATRMGVSTPVISSTIGLLRLPQQMQEAVSDGSLSYKKARAISSALGDEGEEAMLSMWEEAKEQNLKGDDLEQKAARKETKKKRRTTKSVVLEDKEKELELIFGTKVRIKNRKGKSTINMEFFSDEELHAALERLLSLGD